MCFCFMLYCTWCIILCCYCAKTFLRERCDKNHRPSYVLWYPWNETFVRLPFHCWRTLSQITNCLFTNLLDKPNSHSWYTSTEHLVKRWYTCTMHLRSPAYRQTGDLADKTTWEWPLTNETVKKTWFCWHRVVYDWPAPLIYQSCVFHVISNDEMNENKIQRSFPVYPYHQYQSIPHSNGNIHFYQARYSYRPIQIFVHWLVSQQEVMLFEGEGYGGKVFMLFEGEGYGGKVFHFGQKCFSRNIRAWSVQNLKDFEPALLFVANFGTQKRFPLL